MNHNNVEYIIKSYIGKSYYLAGMSEQMGEIFQKSFQRKFPELHTHSLFAMKYFMIKCGTKCIYQNLMFLEN